MRDSHEGMPELIAAYERDGHYFAAVRVTLGQDTRDIEFGIQPDSYKALRRILQTRPFDRLPGVRYRYFIVHTVGRKGDHAAAMDFRIEQGSSGRQLSFEIPFSLAQNLVWFAELKDFAPVSHLHVTPVATREV